MKKIILLTCLIVFASTILAGCQTSNSENGDKYILNSMLPKELDMPLTKESLNNDETRKIIEKYLNLLNQNLNANLENYDIGDLDGDGIDEIVMYVNENNSKENVSKLLVYSYDGEGYYLLDEKEIKYDKGNIKLQIGKISEDKAGIIFCNLANEETTAVYVYLIEDGKLISAINPRKVNLFSVNNNVEIDDIDGDGVLNFNIYTLDPEGNKDENSKIVIWYKWDGKDSADVVKKENLNNEINADNQEYTTLDNSVLTVDDLKIKAKELTKNEFSNLLYEYISMLSSSLNDENKILSSYMNIDDVNKLNDFLKEDSFKNLDSLENVSNLTSNEKLNQFIVEEIKKGYMISSFDNKIVLKINYDYFLNSFNDMLTNEMLSYIRIKNQFDNKPISNSKILIVDKDEIAVRLSEIENFRLVFPYSKALNEVLDIYNVYLDALLFLDDDEESVEKSQYKIESSFKEELIEIKHKYPQSYFSELIDRLLTLVEGIGGGAITATIKDYIRELY
jgi:hypothetical protein